MKGFDDIFVERGLEIYEVKAQCVNCHGPEGVGGQASFIITDENGDFVDQVNWAAPALDTVLWRFSEIEVKDVLQYGRPGSPMAAWGTVGGGPLSDQQLDNVIDYLWSVQLTEAEMREQVGAALEARDPALAERLAAVQEQNAEALATDPTAYECTSGDFACLSEADNLLLGEILFNLSEVASGAYSCARCHVPGASFGAAPAADLGDRPRPVRPPPRGHRERPHAHAALQPDHAGHRVRQALRCEQDRIGPHAGLRSQPQPGRHQRSPARPERHAHPRRGVGDHVYERNLSTKAALQAAAAPVAETPVSETPAPETEATP